MKYIHSRHLLILQRSRGLSSVNIVSQCYLNIFDDSFGQTVLVAVSISPPVSRGVLISFLAIGEEHEGHRFSHRIGTAFIEALSLSLEAHHVVERIFMYFPALNMRCKKLAVKFGFEAFESARR